MPGSGADTRRRPTALSPLASRADQSPTTGGHGFLPDAADTHPAAEA